MSETQARVEEPRGAYTLDVEAPPRSTNAPKRGKPFDGKPGPGRPKGVSNKRTVALREAVEMAARDCHPGGLAGWLVERANGPIGDRQIFAAVVSKVIPMQLNASVQGGISINLGWLAARNIGTNTAQAQMIDAQVVDAIEHSSANQLTTDAVPDDGQGDGQG